MTASILSVESDLSTAAGIADLADRIGSRSKRSRQARRADLAGILRTAVAEYVGGIDYGKPYDHARAGELAILVKQRRELKTAGAELLGQVLTARYLQGNHDSALGTPQHWTWHVAKLLGYDLEHKRRKDLRKYAIELAASVPDWSLRSGSSYDLISSDGTRTYATDGIRIVSLPDDLPEGVYRQNGKAGLIREDSTSFWSKTMPEYVARTLSGDGAITVEHNAQALSYLSSKAAEVTMIRKVYAAIVDLSKLGQPIPQDVLETSRYAEFDVRMWGSDNDPVTFNGAYLEQLLQFTVDSLAHQGQDTAIVRLEWEKRNAVKLSTVVDGYLCSALMCRRADSETRYVVAF